MFCPRWHHYLPTRGCPRIWEMLGYPSLQPQIRMIVPFLITGCKIVLTPSQIPRYPPPLFAVNNNNDDPQPP